MPISSLTITISDPRAIDGWVEAANRNGTTPEAMAAELLAQQGLSYAGLFRIGVITSAAFVARFTPSEYTAIMTAAEQSPEVAALVEQLTASPHVSFSDPRLAPGLEQLAAAGLIAPERVTELQSYERPEPVVGSDGGP